MNDIYLKPSNKYYENLITNSNLHARGLVTIQPGLTWLLSSTKQVNNTLQPVEK